MFWVLWNKNSFGPHHYQLNHFKDDGGYCTKDTFGEYGTKDKLNTFSDGSRLGAVNVHLSLIHGDQTLYSATFLQTQLTVQSKTYTYAAY